MIWQVVLAMVAQPTTAFVLHCPEQLPGPGIMKNRRGKRVKPLLRRRNPVARALRDALFRARREANRRRYSRKPKHRQRSETDHA